MTADQVAAILRLWPDDSVTIAEVRHPDLDTGTVHVMPADPEYTGPNRGVLLHPSGNGIGITERTVERLR